MANSLRNNSASPSLAGAVRSGMIGAGHEGRSFWIFSIIHDITYSHTLTKKKKPPRARRLVIEKKRHLHVPRALYYWKKRKTSTCQAASPVGLLETSPVGLLALVPLVVRPWVVFSKAVLLLAPAVLGCGPFILLFSLPNGPSLRSPFPPPRLPPTLWHLI